MGRPSHRPRPVSRPGLWLRRPASWLAQTGHQAGLLSEAAGLVAGRDRCQAGQAPEPAGPKAGPGRFPGRHDRDGDGGGAMVTTASKRGRGEAGRRPKRKRCSPGTRGEGRGGSAGTAAADSVTRPPAGVERERRDSSSRKLPSTPLSARRERSSRRSSLSASIYAGRTGTTTTSSVA